MTKRFKFEELRVYQLALEFLSHVFKVTKPWPSLYKYSLIDQVHRAALSIVLNIAEGSGRTSKDFQHFLSISRSSCYECVAIFAVAYNEGVIQQKEYESLYDQLDHIARMLTSLKTHLISKAK
jgi:four helix bundle protein